MVDRVGSAITAKVPKMTRLLIFPILLLTMLFVNPVFSADFQKGLEAAQKGDFQTALQEWVPLAEQGHAFAQGNLGLLYENGAGVSQDYKTANFFFASRF